MITRTLSHVNCSADQIKNKQFSIRVKTYDNIKKKTCSLITSNHLSSHDVSIHPGGGATNGKYPTPTPTSPKHVIDPFALDQWIDTTFARSGGILLHKCLKLTMDKLKSPRLHILELSR